MLTLKNYDLLIEKLTEPTGDEQVDYITARFTAFRQNQLKIINELLHMYDSASEHNVDVSRHAIFDLAQRLTSTPEQE